GGAKSAVRAAPTFIGTVVPERPVLISARGQRGAAARADPYSWSGRRTTVLPPTTLPPDSSTSAKAPAAALARAVHRRSIPNSCPPSGKPVSVAPLASSV